MIIKFAELIHSKSDKPWACFETEGITNQGIGVKMFWNDAFIKHIGSMGIVAATEQEMLQLFFLFMAAQVSGVKPDDEMVQPDATPELSSPNNTFKE